MGNSLLAVRGINHKYIVVGGNRFMATKSKLIKVLGLAATFIGVAATLVTDWVNEQKMDEKIEEKVNEALAKRDDEIEES